MIDKIKNVITNTNFLVILGLSTLFLCVAFLITFGAFPALYAS